MNRAYAISLAAILAAGCTMNQSADRDRNARLAETARDVHGARELGRLHADQAEKRAIGLLHVGDELLHRDEHVRLVERRELDLHVVAEHMPAGAVAGQREQAAERVGGHTGGPPTRRSRPAAPA